MRFYLFSVDAVLTKLLTSLSEADNKLSGEQELHFLQSLLQSKEINALVNVHHKVAKMGKLGDRIAPVLSVSMQVI
jgi:MAGUK p55 subfamily member 3/7